MDANSRVLPPSVEPDPAAVPAAPSTATDAVNVTPLTQGAAAPVLPPPPGVPARLGPFRVVKLLGRGGMGAVYLGHDDALDRPVALKVMLPHAAADPAARERFLREGRAVARVKSDFVVTVFLVGDDGGVPFLAMEHLRGAPLDAVLAADGPLPVARLLRVARDAAAGLAAAHAAGLVHRDIKPSNLWVEPDGRVKVLDFGIARAVEGAARLTGAGGVVGTPAYMAPEQARGFADARSDLFALGAVLFHAATGRLPFPGATPIEVLATLATTDAPPASAFRPDLPPAVADLIRRLLAKNPDDRPQAATRVLGELGAIGGVGFAPAESGRGRPAPVSWRPRRRAAGVVALGGGLVVALGWALAPPDELPSQPPQRPPADPPGVAEVVPPKNPPALDFEIPVVPGLPGVPVFPRVPDLPPAGTPKIARVAAAEWVLARGGTLRLADGTRVPPGGKLPGVDFDVRGVDLAGSEKIADDLSPLQEFRFLADLDLTGSTVTDAALGTLGSAKPKTIRLARTAVSDEGMAGVGDFNIFGTLDLADTKVTRDGLRVVVRNSFLKELTLDGLPIGDADIELLGRLSFIETLRVSRTQFTRGGVALLKGTLPRCRVVSDHGDVPAAKPKPPPPKKAGLLDGFGSGN